MGPQALHLHNLVRISKSCSLPPSPPVETLLSPTQKPLLLKKILHDSAVAFMDCPRSTAGCALHHHLEVGEMEKLSLSAAPRLGFSFAAI